MTMWCNKQKTKLLNIPDKVRQTLFETSSLTKEISQKGIFAVQLISQEKAKIFLDEKLLLQQYHSFANVRTVLLSCNEIPVIFARTILPLKYITRELQQLIKLGNKSLGAVLHSSNNIQTGPLEIASINNKYNIYKRLPHNFQNNKNLWTRRTIYQRSNLKLLVNEVFLPEYWNIVCKKY